MAKRKCKVYTKEFRQKVYDRMNGRCGYCGCEITSPSIMEIDHILPVSKGGSNSESNLICSCSFCNKSKYGYTLEAYRTRIENLSNSQNSNMILAFKYFCTEIKPVVFYFEKIKESENE